LLDKAKEEQLQGRALPALELLDKAKEKYFPKGLTNQNISYIMYGLGKTRALA
jgi:hypothetical protein